MDRSYLIAGLIAAGLVAWIASGYLFTEPEPEAAPRAAEGRAPFAVEARRLVAEPVTRHIVSQGEAHPSREASLVAELAGPLEEIVAPQGSRVAQGDVVARVGLGDLPARLEEAQALVEEREAAYEAAVQLGERGFAAEQTLRERRTALRSAVATRARIEREIENATILAAFAGIVDEVAFDEGAFVPVNSELARLIDIDPLVVRIAIPQQSIGEIAVGLPAQVSFVDGRQVEGEVAFVSARADPQTRTFRVEIRVANPDGAIPAGISAETRIPVETVPAHFISPALLSLSTEGLLGVKTVEPGGTVAFHEVEIVQAQAMGLWVANVPEEILLITVGQGFVQEGETVRVVEGAPGTPTEAVGAPGDAVPTGALGATR